MRVLHVVKEGAVLRRQEDRIRVVSGRECIAEVVVRDLEQVVLWGNVTVTGPAVALLVERGVDVVLLGPGGRFRGRIVGTGSGHVALRVAQYRLLSSEQGAFDLARRIVRAKIANQRTLLRRHARRHGRDEALDGGIRALAAAQQRLDRTSCLEEVRGVEGSAAAAYFRALGATIRVEGFRFEERNRRPPMDPVNTLLSLGYTLLFNACEAAIQVVGLDPWLGALHAAQSGRPSLVCDLQEEMRAPAVDALVVGAIHRRVFGPDDFEQEVPGEPVTMKPRAVRRLVELFEARLGLPASGAQGALVVTLRERILRQARALARHVRGEAPYEGWTWR